MEKEIQKEMMNLAYQPNKVAELIYEITLAAKEQSADEIINQIPLSRMLKEAIKHSVYNCNSIGSEMIIFFGA